MIYLQTAAKQIDNDLRVCFYLTILKASVHNNIAHEQTNRQSPIHIHWTEDLHTHTYTQTHAHTNIYLSLYHQNNDE